MLAGANFSDGLRSCVLFLYFRLPTCVFLCRMRCFSHSHRRQFLLGFLPFFRIQVTIITFGAESMLLSRKFSPTISLAHPYPAYFTDKGTSRRLPFLSTLIRRLCCQVPEHKVRLALRSLFSHLGSPSPVPQ